MPRCSPISWTNRDAPRPCFEKPWEALQAHPPRVTPASFIFNSQGLMLLRISPQSVRPRNAWTPLCPKCSRLYLGLQMDTTLSKESSGYLPVPEATIVDLQRILQEAINLHLGVAQALAEALSLLVGNQRHPPKFAVAAPGNLDLDHAVGPHGG